MIKKILIAIDDQLPDLSLVGNGIEFAKQLNAEIGLVDVASLSIGYIENGLYPMELEDLDRQRAAQAIAKVKEAYPNIDFVDFKKVGDPVEEIKEVIRKWQPDMLVVGHHKNSIFQRITENSKERRLINKIELPILVVPC